MNGFEETEVPHGIAHLKLIRHYGEKARWAERTNECKETLSLVSLVFCPFPETHSSPELPMSSAVAAEHKSVARSSLRMGSSSLWH